MKYLASLNHKTTFRKLTTKADSSCFRYDGTTDLSSSDKMSKAVAEKDGSQMHTDGLYGGAGSSLYLTTPSLQPCTQPAHLSGRSRKANEEACNVDPHSTGTGRNFPGPQVWAV